MLQSRVKLTGFTTGIGVLKLFFRRGRTITISFMRDRETCKEVCVRVYKTGWSSRGPGGGGGG